MSDEGRACDESCAQIGLTSTSAPFESGIDQQMFEVRSEVTRARVMMTDTLHHLLRSVVRTVSCFDETNDMCVSMHVWIHASMLNYLCFPLSVCRGSSRQSTWVVLSSLPEALRL